MPDFLSSLKFVVGSVSPLICGSRCDYLDRFVWFRVIVARLTGRWTASGTTGIRRTGTGARTARNAIVSIFPRSRFMIFRWVSSFIMVSGPWSMAIILMSMMISIVKAVKKELGSKENVITSSDAQVYLSSMEIQLVLLAPSLIFSTINPLVNAFVSMLIN